MTNDKNGAGAEVFDIVNLLMIRATEAGGRTMDDMVESGNDVISGLLASYADVALADIAHIAGIVTAMRGSPIRADELRAELMRVGLNLKGQAGTMGYPLLTEVATSLTDFLDDLQKCDRGVADDPQTVLPALQAHVEALCRFMAQGATASGGESARAMIERLGRIVATALPEKQEAPSIGPSVP